MAVNQISNISERIILRRCLDLLVVQIFSFGRKPYAHLQATRLEKVKLKQSRKLYWVRCGRLKFFRNGKDVDAMILTICLASWSEFHVNIFWI